jgi:hypothetical protein
MTIRLKRSATPGAVPTTADLVLGQLAVNTNDGKLFTKKDVSGTQTIVEIGGGGGGANNVGDVHLGYTAPSASWVSTGGYYSKATYPTLASTLGDAPDMGQISLPAPTRLPVPHATPTSSQAVNPQYCIATNGSVTVTVGTNGANSARVQVSSNGTTWTAVSCPITSTSISSVQYVGSYFFITGALGELAYSSDGINWTAALLPIASANRLNTVSYGSGVYVAAGAGMTVFYSFDLITWNIVQSSSIPYSTTSENINRIVFGNGYFVAAASNGLYYSITGSTWQRVWGVTLAVADIQFADNKFVAIGNNAQLYLYSTNGYQWSLEGPNGAIQAEAFVFGSTINNRPATWSATDGTRLVVLSGGNTLYYSDNGNDWFITGMQLPQGAPNVPTIFQLAYGAGSWVAATTIGLYTSTNGVDWIGPQIIAEGGSPVYQCNAIAYGNGVWMAAFPTGIWTSTNLINWTKSSSVANVEAIIYGNTVFRYVTSGGAAQAYSTDNGANWNSATGAPTSGFREMVYSPIYNVWLCIFGTGLVYYVSGAGATWSSSAITGTALSITATGSTLLVGGATRISYSTNGTSWTSAVDTGTSTQVLSVIPTSTGFAAFNGYRYWTSPDGITWSSYASARGIMFTYGFTHPVSAAVYAGRSAGGVFKVSDLSYTPIFTSSTLTNTPFFYNATAIGLANYVNNMIHDGSRFVAVPTVLAAKYSNDGVTWTGDANSSVTAVTTTSSDELYYVNSKYVALAGNSTLYYSSDGNNWSSTAMPTATLQGFAFGASLYVVGATSVSNVVYSSPDLVTWTSRTCNVGAINNIYFYNSNFYAVGTTGVARSPDGITWTVITTGATFRQMYYFNGVFYGVPSAAGVNIYISTTGATGTWSAVQIVPNSNGTQTTQIYSMAYNGTAVVAVGSNGYTARSTDNGATWTYYGVESYGGTPDIRWVTTDGSAFVAVTSTSNLSWYSADGTNWQMNILPTANTTTTNTPVGVVYGSGKWVVYGTNYLAYSTDGQNWFLPSVNSLPFIPFAPYRVTYQNSNWFFTGEGNLTTLAQKWAWSSSTSNLSGSWTHNITTDNSIWYDVNWTGSRYVAVGQYGVYRQSAVSLPSGWTSSVDPGGSSFYAVSTISTNTIAFGINGCIAIGAAQPNTVLQRPNATTSFGRSINNTISTQGYPFAYDSTTSRYICGWFGMTSTDAITWSMSLYRNYNPNFGYGRVKTFSTGVTMMFGVASNAGYTSTDGGVTWTAWRCQNVTSAYNDVAYGGGLYIAITGSGTQLISTDGINWRLHPNTNAAGFHNAVLWTITYDAGIWVAAGNNIYTSTDGYNWTLQISPSSIATYKIQKITLNGVGTWVGMCGGGYVVIGVINPGGSVPNGWRFRRVSTATTLAPLYDFAWNGSVGVLVGAGAVLRTTDFINFTVCASINYINATFTVTWTGTKFVAGPSGAASYWVMYSSDGLNWYKRTIPSRAIMGFLLNISWVNNKLLGITQYGNIFYSGDNLQFLQSYVNSTADVGIATTQRFKEVNGKYFYASSSGNYVSSDGGVTYTNLRTLPGGVANVAYGAGLYVAMVFDFGITTGYTVYTSADGITWTFATELAVDVVFNTGNTGSINAKFVVDVVYASGYFFAAVSPSPQSGVPTPLLRSADGITWTPLVTPFNTFTSGTPNMATDGTTVYMEYPVATSNQTSNNSTAYKSSDAGATWTTVISLGGFPTYASGWWVGASRKTQNFVTYTQSVRTNAALTFGTPLCVPFVYNGWMIGLSYNTSQAVLSIGRLDGTAMYASAKVVSNMFTGAAPFPSIIAVAGLNKIIVPVGGYSNFEPNILMEIPLYSYNTSTTFYVPPENTGTPSYIYTGV